MTSANYETGLATIDDIPAIVAMREVNLHENGGGLSVRQTADWFRHTMSEMPIVVAQRALVVGYALATSIAAKAHVGIVQTMLRAFPAPPNCYLYGPVCVAESERGNGLAAMMYQNSQAFSQPYGNVIRTYVSTTSHRSGLTVRWGKWNLANLFMTARPTSCSHLQAET